MRPDRPALQPRIFWTRQLSTLLRNELESIRVRRTAALGVLDRVTFWRYLLDIVRWQADEGLLDLSQWLKAVAEVLKAELMNSQSYPAPGTAIAMMMVRRFLPEFIADADSARLLCHVLLPGASAIVQAWRSACQSREVTKSGKAVQRKGTKRSFVPNACHAEVTFLLASSLRILDPSAAPTTTELRLSDLERFVKRGEEILESSTESRKSGRHSSKPIAPPRRQNVPADVHRITRECEMLPAHGDVALVVTVVRSISKDGVGATQKAVKTVCHWALVGPVNDRAEAIAIAGALLTHLSRSSKTPLPAAEKPVRSGSVSRRGRKAMHQPRPVAPINYVGSTSASSESSTKEPSLQRELWHFLKELSKNREVKSLDEDDFVVRFIAHVCRLNLLSLSTFVRDVSRLSSCNHSGCAYLVKCLSLLPDPNDRSVADSRRSLLRKFGHVSNVRSNDLHGVDEEAVKAACSGDMSLMETTAQALKDAGKTSIILATCEAVRLEDISQLSCDSLLPMTTKMLFSMVSFLLFMDEPGMAVEWLLDNLGEVVDGGSEWKTDLKMAKRKEIMSILTRLVGDLSRYIAACGHLESVFALLKKGYMSTWVTPTIQPQILHTLASLTCMYGAGSENGSMYWTKMVIRLMKSSAEAPRSSVMIPLAVASLRGCETLLPDEESMADILDLKNRRNWGLSPDEDLRLATSSAHCCGIDVSLLRDRFSTQGTQGRESYLESLFVRGSSANDIIGCVFIPVLADVLSESSADTSLEHPFSELARSVLLMIRRRQTDVRMQGVRPTLVIDLMALIIAGCVCVHMDPSESLEVLVRVKWIWKILAPRAGIELAKRLRARVDFYCDNTATTDKTELSALLSNMVTRVYDGTGRDEIVVSRSIVSEPFGMIEMQLALLAVHRRECAEDDEFGSNVSEAAYTDRDCAHSLTVTALHCCSFDDEYRQAMAGIMAYGAVQVMAESLGYVMTGLTMEATKVTSVHQDRARQWFEVDRARCTALEYCVDGVSDEVGAQVETELFKQLTAVVTQLSKAMAAGCMPSDLLTGGQQLSEALESRLTSILRSKRTRQNVDIWRQRSIEVARLLKASVPLMKRSTIQDCLKVLEMCIKNVGHDQVMSGAGSGIDKNLDGDGDIGKGAISLMLTSKQILQNTCNRELREQLEILLTPTLFWTESPEREWISMLASSQMNPSSATANTVRAVDDGGGSLDSWILLEGYGRGTDEISSVSPSTFWRQGDGRYADDEKGRTVQLKRTYSTFASLAV